MADNDSKENEESSGVDDDAMAAEWAEMIENADDDDSDDDKLAAEWEASEGGGDADDEESSGDPTSRVLNQDEIDSLLGFADDDGNDDNQVTRRPLTAGPYSTNACPFWKSWSIGWSALLRRRLPNSPRTISK